MRKYSLVQTFMLLAAAAVSAACGGSASTAGPADGGSPASNPAAAAGTPFTSPEGKFSVTLPAGFAPFQEKRNEATKMTGFTSSGPNNTACNISYSEFSDALSSQLNTPENIEKALGAMRDNSVMGMGGVPEREEKITVQGQPGLSVYGVIEKVGSTAYFRMDNVIANSRGYRFGCLSTNKEELQKPEMLAFFNSFRLTQ
jgi:hypothetical protein